MGWSMAMSTVLLLAAASLLSLQLLLPPPMASAAAVHANPRLGGYAAKSRPWVSKLVTGFFKKQLRNRGNKQQQQLGSEAATAAAPPLVINISVGTPAAQNFSGLVDITSYLVWAQCAPCAAGAGGCLPPPATTFRPNDSATFSLLACSSDMCLRWGDSQQHLSYMFNLTGVRVDGMWLDAIPAGTFDLKANGSGGVILSSTTPVTFLEEATYDVVREAVASKINLQTVNGSAVDLDLCYNASSMAKVKVPKLTLVSTAPILSRPEFSSNIPNAYMYI